MDTEPTASLCLHILPPPDPPPPTFTALQQLGNGTKCTLWLEESNSDTHTHSYTYIRWKSKEMQYGEICLLQEM